MWQTSCWVTCAKPSRQNTDPGVSHTFSRRFLNQNYPKYISDVVSKILEEKNNYQMFYLNLWSSWNWVSCGESWKSLLPIFLVFHRTDFGGFLVCCYKAIQQLNGVEKSSVAISLMLNHNLTELLPQLNVKYPKFWILGKTTKDSYFWEIRKQSYSKSALKHNPFLWSWTSMKKTIFPDPGRKQK